MALTNKHILLGLSGGIAAYKSADLARRLREAGAEIRVVMTQSATEFITPLTMQTVSGHPVHQHLFDAETESTMGHIDLARWADAVLIAPASANFIAKLASGRADDLLSALCLATTAPVTVAPAMNQQMWDNPATGMNLDTLRKNGIGVFGPGEGDQACGEVGPGRMVEPVELVDRLARTFHTGELEGLKVVVTAGPTWESIDPIRVLTNRSSGKMGYAVAQAAREAGAKVFLVSGPTALPDPDRVETERVTSAAEMRDAVHRHIEDADVFIAAAAVSDYGPAHPSLTKLKKKKQTMTLELTKNPDILAGVAALNPAPFLVGFAAETEDLERNVRKKLEAKKLNLIAANLVGADDTGLGTDANRLLLIDRAGTTELPTASKTQLARALIHAIALRMRPAAPAPTAIASSDTNPAPPQAAPRNVIPQPVPQGPRFKRE